MIYCIINIIGNILVFASVAFLIGKAAWEWDDSYSFIEDRKKVKKEIDKWTKPVVKILLLIWATRLRIIYVIFALVISYYLFKIFIELSGQFFNIDTFKPEEVRNLAIAFIGTTSGLGALFGIYLAVKRSETTERQTYTAEQGLITDRINKATEGLGKKDGKEPVIEVRLGALYALERIAQDSIRDHIQIMEILCAYIRYNSPLPNKNNKEKGVNEDSIAKAANQKNKISLLRHDIQAALTIIGRRDKWPDGEKYLELEKAKGYEIDLNQCDLQCAQLKEANLNNAWFSLTNLSGSKFLRAKLINARIMNAWINDVWLEEADMTNTLLISAKTTNAYAYDVDLSKCRRMTQDQLEQMYCGIKVKIPSDLTRPKHWPTDDLPLETFSNTYHKWRGNKKP